MLDKEKITDLMRAHQGSRSQREAAEECGIGQEVYSRLVRGHYTTLPAETLRLLALWFGCPIEELFHPLEAAA